MSVPHQHSAAYRHGPRRPGADPSFQGTRHAFIVRPDPHRVRAANRSRGGKAFIALPSAAKEGTVSRIVPVLSPGTHVSTSKNDIHYVVTEYGIAQLRGKSARQHARELIDIAHPVFRSDLAARAAALRIL